MNDRIERLNDLLVMPLNVTRLNDMYKKGKGSFYIAQYPVRWTAQSALHFLEGHVTLGPVTVRVPGVWSDLLSPRSLPGPLGVSRNA